MYFTVNVQYQVQAKDETDAIGLIVECNEYVLANDDVLTFNLIDAIPITSRQDIEELDDLIESWSST